MSPTVFKFKGYRFFFFSREEERMHIHVECSDGEAKFWLVPEIELVQKPMVFLRNKFVRCKNK
jgi:hypothetical protein